MRFDVLEQTLITKRDTCAYTMYIRCRLHIHTTCGEIISCNTMHFFSEIEGPSIIMRSVFIEERKVDPFCKSLN